jgi:calcineurin-like phosphoesterase family protein
MKIAALYDIHGNLPALHAVLEELQVIQPDVIVVGGDIVSGPLPGQTLARLMQVEKPIHYIQGNADRELVQTFDKRPLSRRYLPPLSAKGVEEIEWLAQQITRAERDFLAMQPAPDPTPTARHHLCRGNVRYRHLWTYPSSIRASGGSTPHSQCWKRGYSLCKRARGLLAASPSRGI